MTREQLELLVDYIDYKAILATEETRSWNTDWTESRLRQIRDELFKTTEGEQDNG